MNSLASLKPLRRLGLGRLDSVAFGADPSRLWFATSAGLFALDLQSGTTQQHAVANASFLKSSRDGRFLVLFDEMKDELAVWTERGVLVRRFHPGREPRCTAISDDGSLIAWIEQGNELRVGNVKTGRHRALADVPDYSFIGDIELNQSLTFSPDGTTLATANGEGAVHIWDVARGKCLQTFEDWGARAVFFASNGSLVISHAHVKANRGGAFQVRTLDGEEPSSVPFSAPRSRAWEVTTHPLTVATHGELGLAGCDFGALHVLKSSRGTWKVAQDVNLPLPPGVTKAESSIRGLVFSPDGSKAALVMFQDLVKPYPDTTFPALVVFETKKWTVTHVRFDFRLDVRSMVLAKPGFALIGSSHCAALVDLSGTNPDESVPVARRRVESVASNVNGTELLVGESSGSVRILDGLTLNQVEELPSKVRIEATAMTRDGVFRATGGHRLEIWQKGRTTHAPIRVIKTKDRVDGLTFSPDGSKLAVASAESFIQVVEAPKFDVSHRLKAPGATAFFGCAFSSDGEFIAGLYDGVYVWESKRGKLLWHADASPMSVRYQQVTWSPDGEHIWVGDTGGNLECFDVKKRKLLGSVRAHGMEIVGLVLTGDGKTLVSASRDGTLGVWTVPIGKTG